LNLIYDHQPGEILQRLQGSRKALDINGIFQVKICGRLLGGDQACKSRLAALPGSKQGSDRVYLKRIFNLMDGLRPWYHASIIDIENL
jgi:hypothetical protein